ncbi:MAG: hypothetical protein RL469_1354 [Pseudomonadota bacterium]|jgi:cell division inhibitor SulA/protein ImuA
MRKPGLEPLLAHPAIWRGRSVARTATHSTGFPTLDDALPGGGWPLAALTEILTPHPGAGELRLLIPLLRAVGAAVPPRWVAWIAPPFEPYAPALAAAAVPPERQLVVRTTQPLWALEQTLDSGACAVALAWLERVQAATRELRRLQLATQRQGTPAFVFRAARAATQASPAELRIAFEPQAGGARLQLIKSRGGARAPFELRWEVDHGTP